MLVFPNAKINIGLHVLSNRLDGYHNIETVMYPIDFYDVLEILPSTKTELSLSGISMSGDINHNLVLKTFYRLKQLYRLSEIKIFLRKNIPLGAGLGGGSSDGAFMLRLLNNFFKLHLSLEQLERRAEELGSDCSFFIRNQPVFAEGKGTLFSQIILQNINNYEVILVTPDISISTKKAYSVVSPHTPRKSLRSITQLPIYQWKDYIMNDFEPVIFSMYPEIKEIKQELYKRGAIYAGMSGSGSSIFGLFEKSCHLNRTFDFPVYHFI